MATLEFTCRLVRVWETDGNCGSIHKIFTVSRNSTRAVEKTQCVAVRHRPACSKSFTEVKRARPRFGRGKGNYIAVKNKTTKVLCLVKAWNFSWFLFWLKKFMKGVFVHEEMVNPGFGQPGGIISAVRMRAGEIAGFRAGEKVYYHHRFKRKTSKSSLSARAYSCHWWVLWSRNASLFRFSDFLPQPDR